jgi:Ser/Thr protein kinase RdoA (MazF antagonist)
MSDQATDLFLSLTPERVLDAVEAAGLDCAPVCHPLNSFENRVYDVLLRDGTRVVAKFYRPGRWSKAQISEEHSFMTELVENEVPICGLRPFPDGTTLRQIDAIWYCLYDRFGGRAPEDLDDESVERLGMMAARIHNVGATRDAPSRVRVNADTYVRDNLAWLSLNDVLPVHLHDRFMKAADAVADLADQRMGDVETIRIHGDFHPGNVLVREGRFHVLDFDDMVVGPAVQDLWLLLPGRDTHTVRQREVFLEAYGHFRDFDRGTLDLIEPLRGLRRVHYATWLARRWHDPLFPATWPQFGSEDWWTEEAADLEDVLAHSAAGGVATGQFDADAPTNADLFWDWEEPPVEPVEMPSVPLASILTRTATSPETETV